MAAWFTVSACPGHEGKEYLQNPDGRDALDEAHVGGPAAGFEERHNTIGPATGPRLPTRKGEASTPT